MGYLRNHDVRFEPIERWPKKQTTDRKRSPFRSSIEKTKETLDFELWELDARNVVLQVYLDRSQLRLDGMPRAGANPASPGVIVSFDSKNGPMSLPCDQFDRWTDNLRAIALALEALRKIDRYGVTQSGEQYRGWQALPQPETIERMIPTVEAAMKFLRSLVTTSAGMPWADVVRRAQFITHPDRGGDPDDFKRVMRSEQLLKEAGCV